MKTITTCMAILTATALIGTAWAEDDRESPQLCLELNLVDGSRVIGIPGITSVPLQTSYAKMNVELKQIMTIRIGEDHETASLDLQNGDKLKGVITLEPIKLKTIFGQVAIGVHLISDLRVVQPGSELPDVLKKGLVLHYTFDRNDGDKLTDQSNKSHRGTAIDGAKWGGSGRHGGAYRMTGGRSRIEVADSPAFNLKPDENKTFCIWWKKEGDIQHKVLLSKWSVDNNGRGFALLTLSTERRYYLPFQQHHWAQFSAPFSDTEWNHVAVVKTGTSYKIYHNGQEAPLVASMGWPMAVDTTVGKPFEIGGTHMADYGFEGLVADVMVFDRALPADEISKLYEIQK